MRKEFTVEAEVSASDLSICSRLASHINNAPITVSGHRWDKYTLLYAGFGGTLPGEGKSKGRHLFQEIEDREEAPEKKHCQADFTKIPGLEVAENVQRSSSCHSDTVDPEGLSEES